MRNMVKGVKIMGKRVGFVKLKESSGNANGVKLEASHGPFSLSVGPLVFVNGIHK